MYSFNIFKYMPSEWFCNIFALPLQWLHFVQTIMKSTSIDDWKRSGRGCMSFKRYLSCDLCQVVLCLLSLFYICGRSVTLSCTLNITTPFELNWLNFKSGIACKCTILQKVKLLGVGQHSLSRATPACMRRDKPRSTKCTCNFLWIQRRKQMQTPGLKPEILRKLSSDTMLEVIYPQSVSY